MSAAWPGAVGRVGDAPAEEVVAELPRPPATAVAQLAHEPKRDIQQYLPHWLGMSVGRYRRGRGGQAAGAGFILRGARGQGAHPRSSGRPWLLDWRGLEPIGTTFARPAAIV